MSKLGILQDNSNKVIEICEICGSERKIGPKGLIDRCNNCGYKFNVKIQSVIDNITEDVSSKTHDRYSWFCSECSHRGLKWMNIGETIKQCPNCKTSRLSMRIKRLDPTKGSCKTIWESMQIEAKPIPLHADICHACGHGYQFRLTRPYRCSECGAEGAKFKHVLKVHHD